MVASTNSATGACRRFHLWRFALGHCAHNAYTLDCRLRFDGAL